MSLQKLAILLLTLGGFALRLHYLTTSHPFFDEYTTVLAARQILRHGWPLLPSGLFYEHGLLATYLIAPFTALFINSPVVEWQAAQWGLMLARWPSLLLSTATIPLIYTIAHRCFSSTPHAPIPQSPQPPISQSPNYQLPITNYHAPIPLLAAGLFAFSPEGMVWGGRARMYALATLLLLLTVYWAYRGTHGPAPATYRWLALLTLAAVLLTQFGALMIVPPLIVAMLVVGWLMRGRRAWFLRPTVLPEGAALLAILSLAIVIKRLGRPLGVESLADTAAEQNLLLDLFNSTIAYQTAFYFTWADTLDFLARQFGVPHHFWLTLITLLGTALVLIAWPTRRRFSFISSSPYLPISPSLSPSLFPLFLWLTFGLVILEMVTLLEPFRRNPRYLVMLLPLFYLLAAYAIVALLRFTFHVLQLTPSPSLQTVAALIILGLLIAVGFHDLRVALITPEPAYEQAFAHIHSEWQAGDRLLTMNTPAAELYLGQVDGFTVQNEAEQFLLETENGPVDRWVGLPWIGTAADFNAALNRSERVWFVIDTIRQPVYFQGNWLALLNHQMEPVWAEENALVYRTRPDRTPLPSQPEQLVEAKLGDSVELIGYTLRTPPVPSSPADLNLTLFWETQANLPTDYTLFLHLRNREGATLAQRDGLPLEGAYPTSLWQPGETVIDPITWHLPADLPPDSYELFTGLYRLDTLERLPVANDTTGENAIRLGEVTLP